MIKTLEKPSQHSETLLHETVTHYNEDPEFYASFLDPYMKYTSGLFDSNATSLELACRNMLDKIIQKAQIPLGGSVLEIGPGWGSLLKRLREARPDVRFSGISPSAVQNRFIRRTVFKDAELHTTTFELANLNPAAFDAVILIGSFCHLRDKPEMLKKIRKFLKPTGRVVVEDTFFLSPILYERHANHPATKFVQQEVFGFAEIPPLSAMIDMAPAADLRFDSTLEHSDSYRRTIAEWQKRIRARPPSTLGERYLAYMDVFQMGWDYTIANHLIVMRPAMVRTASRKEL